VRAKLQADAHECIGGLLEAFRHLGDREHKAHVAVAGM
jgi:hypothetical protein